MKKSTVLNMKVTKAIAHSSPNHLLVILLKANKSFGGI